MRMLVLFIACVSISISLSGQVNPVPIEGSYSSGAFDALNNFYLVSGNECLKYDSDGKLSGRFSQPILGHISSIDVSDPLKPFIFYFESQTVVFLNQQLTPVTEPVNISENNQFNAQVACYQPGYGFWFFDQNTQTLCRMNNSKTVDIQSIQVSGQLNGNIPTRLIFAHNQLHLISEPSGILVFDQFGNFISRVELSFSGPISVVNEALFFSDGAKMYEWKMGMEIPIEIKLESPTDFINAFRGQYGLVLIDLQSAHFYKDYFHGE